MKGQKTLSESASGKWIPKVGDHVFHVCEFILDDYRLKTKIPGYHRNGFEIVESVVKSPYHWHNAGMGIHSVTVKQEIGDTANNCFFWKPKDYGTRVFRTFEEAIPLAEEQTKYYEEHYKYGNEPMYRHWI